MKSRLFSVAAAGLFFAAASASAAQDQEPAETVLVNVGGAGLVIESPRAWQPGIMNGPAMLLHFIGAGDGFPHFSAMADHEAALEEDTTPAEERDAIEQLFAAITGDDEVLEAGWTTINEIEVHSSLTVRGSVAGPIQRRRLLFVHHGAPYVLVWAHYADRYADVAELVEHCVATLARGQAGSRIAAPDS